VFKCGELEEIRARTIHSMGLVRGFEDLLKMEKGTDLLKEFVKESELGMVGWLEKDLVE
jgi:hypothetical protein